MPSNDEQLPLDYTPDWIALGIVTAENIHRDQHEFEAGDDPHPEHYRWRAFCRFLAAQESLSLPLAQQLYTLGASDAAPSMGSSLMAAVLRHSACPRELLHAALASGQPHLQRIAHQRLSHPFC